MFSVFGASSTFLSVCTSGLLAFTDLQVRGIPREVFVFAVSRAMCYACAAHVAFQ
jgi:hypothetical protein